MKKTTVVAILLVTVLLAALAVSLNAVFDSRSYQDCALRLAGEAPSGDRLPPESFRRLSRAFWGKRDVYLARVLAHECAMALGKEPRGLGRQLVVLGTLAARLPSDQRESLAAVFIPAYGGRGLTHSAQTEWDRPPAALTDAEMTWLFVVGQDPSCTRARAVPERDEQYCADVYKRMLAELPSLDSAAPVTWRPWNKEVARPIAASRSSTARSRRASAGTQSSPQAVESQRLGADLKVLERLQNSWERFRIQGVGFKTLGSRSEPMGLRSILVGSVRDPSF